MLFYIFKRLLLITPTLLGIMLINFVIVQFLPGGPVEQMIASLQSHSLGQGVESRISAGDEQLSLQADNNNRHLDPEIIKEIEKIYELDKPATQRFFSMIVRYARFDFGNSFFMDRSVVEIILEKMPVSISLGLWTTILVYLISIPLGIYKAVKNGSRFDAASSTIIVTGYAIPNFLFAVFLIIIFASGEFLNWFPLRGLVSDDFSSLSPFKKVLDYFHHLALPLISMVIGGFASLTLLTKNCFLDEIHKQYVFTALSKGLSSREMLLKHVFRNAMLLIISSFPSALVSILFTSSLLIEVIFSLDGLGRLGFDAALKHDYPIVFGTLFFFSLLGLLLRLISDLTYVMIDPRIDFETNKQT